VFCGSGLGSCKVYKGIRTSLPNVGKLVWVTGGGKDLEEEEEEEGMVDEVNPLVVVEKTLDDDRMGSGDVRDGEGDVEVKSEVIKLESKVVKVNIDVKERSVVSDESNVNPGVEIKSPEGVNVGVSGFE